MGNISFWNWSWQLCLRIVPCPRSKLSTLVKMPNVMQNIPPSGDYSMQNKRFPNCKLWTSCLPLCVVSHIWLWFSVNWRPPYMHNEMMIWVPLSNVDGSVHCNAEETWHGILWISAELWLPFFEFWLIVENCFCIYFSANHKSFFLSFGAPCYSFGLVVPIFGAV